jgi:CHAT domain-containing protein
VRGRTEVSRSLGRSTGFAEAFLRGGVASFIGTWWPVSDDAASRFAASLYGAVLEGQSIGAAVQAARAAVRNSRSGDWANYLHYGSHDFALKRPPPQPATRRRRTREESA